MRVPHIAKATVIYGAVPIIERGLKLALLPLYTERILPAEYGVWALILAISALINVCAPLGMNSAFSYSIRRQDCWKSNGKVLQGNSFKSAIVLITVSYIIAYPFCLLYPTPVKAVGILWAIGLADGWLRYILNLILKKLQMLEKPKQFFAYSGTEAIVSPIAAWILVGYFDLGIFGVAYANLIGLTIVTLPIMRHVMPELKTKFSWLATREALIFGLPLVFHAVSSWAVTMIDRLMIERLANLSELGFYSLGAQVSAIVLYAVDSMNRAYIPVFFRLYGKAGVKIQKIRQIQAGIFGVVILVCGSWFFLLPLIFRFFVDEQYSGSFPVSRILVLAHFSNGIYSLVVGYLFFWKRTFLIASCSMFTLVINILFNFWFIPKWQGIGAAWATVISQTTLAICVVIVVFCLKRFSVSPESKSDLSQEEMNAI